MNLCTQQILLQRHIKLHDHNFSVNRFKRNRALTNLKKHKKASKKICQIKFIHRVGDTDCSDFYKNLQ